MLLELRTFDISFNKTLYRDKEGNIVPRDIPDTENTMAKNQLILLSDVVTVMEATEATKKRYNNDFIESIVTVTSDGKHVSIPCYNSYENIKSCLKEFYDGN